MHYILAIARIAKMEWPCYENVGYIMETSPCGNYPLQTYTFIHVVKLRFDRVKRKKSITDVMM